MDDHDDRADWLNHPTTQRLLKGYRERRWKQLQMIISSGSACTDPKIVSLVAHFRALDAEVQIHGGDQFFKEQE